MYVNKYHYGVFLELLTPVDLSMKYSEAITIMGVHQGFYNLAEDVYRGGYTSAGGANSCV